jgi:hypothetical protein
MVVLASLTRAPILPRRHCAAVAAVRSVQRSPLPARKTWLGHGSLPAVRCPPKSLPALWSAGAHQKVFNNEDNVATALSKVARSAAAGQTTDEDVETLRLLNTAVRLSASEMGLHEMYVSLLALGRLAEHNMDVDPAAVKAVSGAASRLASEMKPDHLTCTLLALGRLAEGNMTVDPSAVNGVSGALRRLASEMSPKQMAETLRAVGKLTGHNVYAVKALSDAAMSVVSEMNPDRVALSMWVLANLTDHNVDVDPAAVRALSDAARSKASEMWPNRVAYTLLAFGILAKNGMDVDPAAVKAVSDAARRGLSELNPNLVGLTMLAFGMMAENNIDVDVAAVKDVSETASRVVCEMKPWSVSSTFLALRKLAKHKIDVYPAAEKANTTEEAASGRLLLIAVSSYSAATFLSKVGFLQPSGCSSQRQQLHQEDTAAAASAAEASLEKWREACDRHVSLKQVLPMGMGDRSTAVQLLAWRGDALLGLVMRNALVARYDTGSGGEHNVGLYTKAYSALVSNKNLSEHASRLVPCLSESIITTLSADGGEGGGGASKPLAGTRRCAGTLVEACIALVHDAGEHSAVVALGDYLVEHAVVAASRVAKANAKQRLLTMGGQVKSNKVKVNVCRNGDENVNENEMLETLPSPPPPPATKFQAIATRVCRCFCRAFDKKITLPWTCSPPPAHHAHSCRHAQNRAATHTLPGHRDTPNFAATATRHRSERTPHAPV